MILTLEEVRAIVDDEVRKLHDVVGREDRREERGEHARYDVVVRAEIQIHTLRSLLRKIERKEKLHQALAKRST